MPQTVESSTPFLTYDRTLGVAAMENRGFYYPVDTAINRDGRIYGLSRSHEGDPRGVRVCILDLESKFHGVFGSIGELDGQFTWAASIAVDSAGKVYVGDEYLERISIFDVNGIFESKWGDPGADPGQLNGPCGLAFDIDSNLYISDHRNNRVQKFTADGEYLSGFGKEGNLEGEFNLPWGLTVATDGDIYVADWRNDRIQRFTSEGEFVRKYGGSGNGDGEFHRPASVAVDTEGYIYIADWGNERVQVLDPDGGFVTKIRGDATISPWAQQFLDANVDESELRSNSNLETAVNIRGTSEHEISSHIEHLFWSPISVKLDNTGRLYVTDRNRHRIQVYKRP